MDTAKTSTKLKRKNSNSDREVSTSKRAKTEKDILAYLSDKDKTVKDKGFLESMRKCSLPQINEEILEQITIYFETGDLFKQLKLCS